MAKRIIYVLIGPPAIGKSTWINKYVKNPNDAVIISNDKVVEEVAESLGWSYGDMFVIPPSSLEIGYVDKKYGEVIPPPPYMSWAKSLFSKVTEAKKNVNELFNKMLEDARQTEKNVIVDLTNMTIKSRKSCIEKIKKKDDYIVAVVFKFKNQEKLIKTVAKKRNEVLQRSGKDKYIPDVAIEKAISSYEPPSPSENFDKIIYSDTISQLKQFTQLKEIIRKEINKLFENNIQNEAYIHSFIPKEIFELLGIDSKKVSNIGEGSNGIAFRYGDKTIKITSDAEEAEFSAAICGHKLSTVANVFDVYEYDSGQGEDNKHGSKFYSSRYYWIIIKEYVPHNFRQSYVYADALNYFDNYQEKNNFSYSIADFDKMISEYRNDHLEIMSDEENYDPEEDYELEETLDWFEFFKKLHVELEPTGILSVSDMKSSNMGFNDDGEPVYIELHIYKITSGYNPKPYKMLSAKKQMAENYKNKIYEISDTPQNFFAKEEYKDAMKRLEINSFEELVGQSVIYIKPVYGEHKVLKWIPERKEYLLFTEGYKVLANPFQIFLIPNQTKKSAYPELEWVVKMLCEKTPQEVIVKNYSVNENASLNITFDAVFPNEKFFVVKMNVSIENKTVIPKIIFMNNSEKQQMEKYSLGKINIKANDIDIKHMIKIIETIILETI